jgi:hypothetical protein
VRGLSTRQLVRWSASGSRQSPSRPAPIPVSARRTRDGLRFSSGTEASEVAKGSFFLAVLRAGSCNSQLRCSPIFSCRDFSQVPRQEPSGNRLAPAKAAPVDLFLLVLFNPCAGRLVSGFRPRFSLPLIRFCAPVDSCLVRPIS